MLHRSYSNAGDHVRVEIENPGRFPGLADPAKPLSISRYARNPRMVRVCSDLGIARDLGEGIKRIFSKMRTSDWLTRSTHRPAGQFASCCRRPTRSTKTCGRA